MKHHTLRRAVAWLVFALTIISSGVAFAYAPPQIQGYVTDTAKKLTPEEVKALDEKLATYRQCSDNHVIVFIVDSLVGNTVEDVAYATFNTWKPGHGKDNGVLLVIAPNERKVRIETGKGVGGALTDIESNRILREHVSSNLKKDQFFAAVDEGTTEIERALERDSKKPCTVTAAAPPPAPTTPAPSASQTPVFVPDPVPAPSSEDRVFSPLRIVIFILFAGVLGTIFAPAKGDGFILGVGSMGFAGLVGGTVCSSVLPAFLGMIPTLVIGVVALVLCVVGRIFARRNRSSGSSDPFSSGGGSSFDNSSSAFDSSSSSSSWDSGSSGSSGSSGIDTSYSGGDGSSGGGGSSDSY